MRLKKYHIKTLFLIVLATGKAESQTNDVLILNDGVRYEGRFLGIRLGKVEFQPHNAHQYTPIGVSMVKKLKYYGTIIIMNGICQLHQNKGIPNNEGVSLWNCELK